jgi:hypothetical protein
MSNYQTICRLILGQSSHKLVVGLLDYWTPLRLDEWISGLFRELDWWIAGLLNESFRASCGSVKSIGESHHSPALYNFASFRPLSSHAIIH